MSKLARALLGMSKAVANLRGRKPKYTISKNGISMTYEKMKDTEDTPYDFETYPNCQVFIKGYANPVKITLDDIKEGYDLIPSKKYKTFMKQNVISQAFFSKGMKIDKIFYLLIANLAAVIVFSLAIVSMLS